MAETIAVAGGTVRLRPARPRDEHFLFDLFRAHSAGVLKLGRLPQVQIDELLAAQYKSRARSFRERFPQARWSIVEFAGDPIGELILHDDADALWIVDIALRPEYQRRGIGSALVRSLIAAGVPRGGLRARVLMTHAASLSMFRHLGFVDTGHDAAHIELRWQAANVP